MKYNDEWPHRRFANEERWGARPLTDLVDHLRLQRYPLLDARMAAVTQRFAEAVCQPEAPWAASVRRLRTAFEQLQEAVSRCAMRADDVYRVAAAREGPAGPDGRACEESSAVLLAARGERERLRAAVDAVQDAVDALMVRGLPLHLALACQDVDTVLLLIIDQLHLEDHHLWPRLGAPGGPRREPPGSAHLA